MQKNGNVHYHIVTDCFMDFHIVQKIWNRCIDKLGYVQEYSKKHNLMTLQPADIFYIWKNLFNDLYYGQD